jgi:3-dehydroquinate synthase
MGISHNRSKIIFSQNLRDDLILLISKYSKCKIFLATESRVNNLWLHGNSTFDNIPKIVLPAGEENKKLSSVAAIWEFLSNSGADRKSVLFNVGGGMLTDLAGFAASTFKRGIDFVNIPTTLLSQVDASVGGKTGINFNSLKNEIGTFREPEVVVIYPPFLQTLDKCNLLSGYAEMIKHGLIYNPEHLTELMEFDLENINHYEIQELIRHSVEVKKYFVASDPFEKNIRKALNFGHTIGHAFESYAMKQEHPVLHGYAVAWGMISELFLSVETCGFPVEDADRISRWIIQLYGKPDPHSFDFSGLTELMQHDKKNENNRINFTLLSGIGQFEINQNCSKEQITESLKYMQNL